jgi:hypothetical protein
MVGRKIAKKVVELGKKIVDVFSANTEDYDGEFKNLKRAGTVDDLLGRKQVAVVPEDGTMVIMATKGSAATKPGWLQVKIQNLDGNGVDLLVMPQATVLQMKHAVAKVEGTPPFQQDLWAEGAEEEMQNTSTAAENGLTDRCKVFLIKVSEHIILVDSVCLITCSNALKFDAPSWQTAMLTEPGLFACLGDFMALSMWREEGGYDQAGKTMEAELLKWWHWRTVLKACAFRECARLLVLEKGLFPSSTFS